MMMTRTKRWITMLMSVVMLACLAPLAMATDTIVLKDGTRVEGEIVREVNGAVWLKTTIGGLENTKFYGPSQVSEILRDTGDEPAPETPVDSRLDSRIKVSDVAGRDGTTRIAVITLEEMVGTYMSAKPLHDAIPALEEEGVDVVVLKINSGGGALLEIARIQNVIVNELKPRFRVVAWIESAISAAAMSTHVVEDIYFMPEGNYGACTGWYGQLVAVKGRGLEEVLYQMEKASQEGRKDPKIMRSMQITEPLSCSIDQYGVVTWYQNEDGDYLVNPEGNILTFNSETALKYGFSKGTARNIDELAHEMGYTEYEYVGDHVDGLMFPVCKAEKQMRKWREGIARAEKRLNEFRAKYNISVANADGAQDKRERGTFLGRATRELAQIERIVKDYPNIALFNMNMLPDQAKEWFRQQHELLDEIRRRG